jgi:transposase
MPTEKISMRKIREILRLTFVGQLKQHQVAASVQLSQGSVSKYLSLAKTAGLSWPLPPELDDVALDRLLFPGSGRLERGAERFAAPDFPSIHAQLKRKGVTLQLLWEEYRAAHGEASYSYSQFCSLYRLFRGSLQRSMRQTHIAGEKLFVDYCGPTVDVIDTASGEVRAAQIFVAVLGASNYTYAEATWTQQLPDWIGSHVRALSFIGGCTALIVPDNVKTAVTKACRYEPDLHSSYAEFAAHYGTAILPTRPYKPKDKAKAEVGVQVVERWVLARLRHQTFFSLQDLNGAIRRLMEDLNNRPFKKLPGSRRSQYEAVDKPALRPLPSMPYEYAEWRKVRVNIDYHVEVDGHYYSVPHRFVKQQIDARLTAATLECFAQGVRIAAHARSPRRGAHSTQREHMPKAHQKHSDWTPGRFLNWAITIGPRTRDVVKHLLEDRPHPEHGYRSCLGLLNLAKRYGEKRLETACERALTVGAPTRKSVLSILEKGLDKVPLTTAETEETLPAHDNVRGANYYH